MRNRGRERCEHSRRATERPCAHFRRSRYSRRIRHGNESRRALSQAHRAHVGRAMHHAALDEPRERKNEARRPGRRLRQSAVAASWRNREARADRSRCREARKGNRRRRHVAFDAHGTRRTRTGQGGVRRSPSDRFPTRLEQCGTAPSRCNQPCSPRQSKWQYRPHFQQ